MRLQRGQVAYLCKRGYGYTLLSAGLKPFWHLMNTEKHTPLMQQYHDIRREHPDTLLFFQVGDFYELFFEDAKKASAFLGIALTARGKSGGEPIPLCGVPIHAKEHYLHKLIKGGFRVAICDQQEEPTPGKLVRRAVTQVLTPGTLTDSKLLDEKSASYLFSFYPGEREWTLLFGELLTAQLWATTVPANSERIVESELARFFPDELLIPNIKAAKPFIPFFKKQGYFTTLVDGDIRSDGNATAQEWLQRFPENTQQLIQKHESMRLALYYFYAYIKRTQQTSLDQFNQLFVYKPEDFLVMDAATQRNLELIRNNQNGGYTNTLFAVMDGATTPMGSRMIKKWLQRPLIKKEAIVQRQDAIAAFVCEMPFLQTMQQLLASMGDMERMVGRIALSRAQHHDYTALKKCLEVIPEIRVQLQQYSATALFNVISSHMADFSALSDLLHRALHDEPGGNKLIKAGFDQQLDYMRNLIENSNRSIVELERKEQGETTISSLKIRYNNVHGYYIEITNPNKHLVPERYKRRQTLVGKERYTTPELLSLAHEIERAHAQIEAREKELFDQVKRTVAEQSTPLRKLAHALAHLDAIHGFAKVAYNNGYIRPTFTDTRDITIADGRHPIVEQNAQTGFIPNDTNLNDAQSLWIITGPNMGGKSTYLRQVALLCIMAQCGAFVPAKRAELALLDRVFTRIGAGDNLAAGKSTFLVEMEETASICAHATKKSLVILDEVGRGTSTFDGLAIAHAVIEYLYTHIGARCLFATHYHELTTLPAQYPGIVPFYAASKKTDSGIVFLYKIMQGVADGSFGIEVAKLANLPDEVISKAVEHLKTLTEHEQAYAHHAVPAVPADVSGVAESDCVRRSSQERSRKMDDRLLQENRRLKEKIAALQKQAAIITELQNLSLDELTPKQAFDLLWQWKDHQA
ncbi:DNA mismatch repair protein MutS [Candidatus Dependentiae bacterium]|nr:MAG: DNA mismatch repair protein MutS [Candidatus Dependentiae bacterium]